MIFVFSHAILSTGGQHSVSVLILSPGNKIPGREKNIICHWNSQLHDLPLQIFLFLPWASSFSDSVHMMHHLHIPCHWSLTCLVFFPELTKYPCGSVPVSLCPLFSLHSPRPSLSMTTRQEEDGLVATRTRRGGGMSWPLVTAQQCQGQGMQMVKTMWQKGPVCIAPQQY